MYGQVAVIALLLLPVHLYGGATGVEVFEAHYDGMGGEYANNNNKDSAEQGHSIRPRQTRVNSATSATRKFPLPSCYINGDGFLCCSSRLETLMIDTYDRLKRSRPRWSTCNIHQVSVAMQRALQKAFNVSVESVAGAGDFASKNFFTNDLICKIRRDDSIILAFATPPNKF